MLAQLAGFTPMYVSYIERGLRTVDKRQTLEAFANALRVSPAELTATPWEHPHGEETRGAVVALEAVLEATELGEDQGVPVRQWPEIVADIDRLSELRKRAEYGAQGELVPRLLTELHGAYVRLPEHRRDVLHGMIHCYSAVAWITRRLGGRGLSLLAARLVQVCADELEALERRAYATWLRSQVAGPLSRPQQCRRAIAVAEEITPQLSSPEVLQAYGMLHFRCRAGRATVTRDASPAACWASASTTRSRTHSGSSSKQFDSSPAAATVRQRRPVVILRPASPREPRCRRPPGCARPGRRGRDRRR
jgi:transcriptional regulator with XRE-family HTH domain